jgi:hypothetical protein
VSHGELDRFRMAMARPANGTAHTDAERPGARAAL